jgi:AcrR family transcriptional regulator
MDGGKNLGGGTLARQKQVAREEPGTAGRDNVTRSARAEGVAKEGTRVARGSGRAAQGAKRDARPNANPTRETALMLQAGHGARETDGVVQRTSRATAAHASSGAAQTNSGPARETSGIEKRAGGARQSTTGPVARRTEDPRARTDRARRGRSGAGQGVAPLYERLPRGPHQLDPLEVAENQRRRMYGAMIEAVAASGYGRTSVKQVVTLAGVSRRAFYEQFANKEECFLATLELIASQAMDHIAAGYRSTEGTLEQRMRAALSTFAEVVKNNPKGARLMLVDAPSAGPAGWERLTLTMNIFERRLAASFEHAPDAAALPEPVARAIVGGLRRATFVRLLEQRTSEMPELVEDMLSWTLVFRTTEPSPLGVRLLAVPGHAHLGAEGERARVLRSALELAALEGYGNLTPMRIADEARVSIDTFFDFFDDMEECFLAAIEKLGMEVRETVSDPGLTSAEWPAAVRRSLDAMMRYFAARPAYAQTIATGVFAMGQRAVDLVVELAREVATKLTAGAPNPPSSGLAREGIEGAIWHMIYCHTTNGGTGALPELSDYLTYVVLAPYLGADQAAQLVSEARASKKVA